MKPRYVFVDESGDPSLLVGTPGVSPYFVLSALIVEADELTHAEEAAKGVITAHFQTGEMKSSGVGANVARRRRILADIATIPFKHYSQVIDKASVRTDTGLRFKKSFIKFIHRATYQQLLRGTRELHVVADQHGTSAFMAEFGEYLVKRLPRTLFEASTFRFAESRSTPLIQVCDMVAGSVARAYAGQDPRDILRPLRASTIIIDEWPPKPPAVVAAGSGTVDDDRLVRTEAVLLAQQFIDANAFSNEPLVVARVAAIRYLLYHFRAVDPQQYVPTRSLHAHLRELGHEMSERFLRSSVIGSLRDENVFIVSSEKGIKLPFEVKDLRRFVAQVDQRVVPYLGRLQKLRRHFLLASNGRIEIVEEAVHPALHKLLPDRG